MFAPTPNGGNGYNGLWRRAVAGENTSGREATALAVPAELFEPHLRQRCQLGRHDRAGDHVGLGVVDERLGDLAQPELVGDLVIVDPDQMLAGGCGDGGVAGVREARRAAQ